MRSVFLYSTQGNFKYLIQMGAGLTLALFLFLILSTTLHAAETITTESVRQLYTDQTLGETQTGVQTQSVGGGGVSGTEAGTAYVYNAGLDAYAPQVNIQSGAMQHSYALKLPPGRNNLTPQLSLNYNSNNTDNLSMFGYGWNISIPSIKRINKTGVQNLFTTDFFESSIDGELVRTSTSTFVPKVENGSFRKYQFQDNVWTVTEKDGARYTFGSTSQSRQDDARDSTKIYGWMLEEIRDANNNFISFTYFKETGVIYPSQISYTGNNTTPGIFTVAFERQQRPDQIISYSMGFAATSSSRISNITASINGVWVKKYTLSYTSGSNGARSTLGSITESGQDDSSGIITLPPTVFGYEKHATATKVWEDKTLSWSVPENFIRERVNYDDGVRPVDINGDGLVDIIRFSDANLYSGFGFVPLQRVYLNTGTSWVLSNEWQLPQPVSGRMAFTGTEPVNILPTIDLGARFADVNGDGYVDILWGFRSNYLGNAYGYQFDIPYVYLNNKINGWSTSTEYELPPDIRFVEQSVGAGVEIADINGDGLPDLLKSTQMRLNAVTTVVKKVYLNTGSGWQDATERWNIPEPFMDQQADAGTQLADVNNDGLVDIMRSVDSDYNYSTLRVNRTYLNTGSGWVEAGANWRSPVPFIFKYLNSGLRTRDVKFVDVNGDGLGDLYSNTLIFLNTGSGWVSDAWTGQLPTTFTYTSGYTRTADAGTRLFDLDGDNMLDFIKSYSTASYPTATLDQMIAINKANVPDLLTSITQPEGGVMTTEYTQTELLKNDAGVRLNPSLPYILNVVATTTYNNLVDTPYTNTFSYAGGSHFFNSITDRQFAGFASTSNIDGFGNKTVTYYHQGNGTTTASEVSDTRFKIGKVYRTEQLDQTGNIYKISLNRWDTTQTSSSTEYVYKIRDLTRDYDGNATTKDSAVEYSFNPTNGNIRSIIEWGEVTGTATGTFIDIGSDKRTSQYGYATNTLVNIIGLPIEELLVDKYNATVRRSKYYYDALPFGQVSTGNRTKTESWISGSLYSSTTNTYNNFGLVTQSVDPRGKVTTYGYDAYNLYPITTTNPLGHITNLEYDYSLGKAKSVTDANNNTTTYIYDGVDRLVSEKILDPQTGTPVTKSTTAYKDIVGARSILVRQFLDAAKDSETYEYYDGFGKKRQTRLETEDVGLFATRDYRYGPEGLLYAESLPYISSGSSSTVATTTTQLFTLYRYDPLKRIKSVNTILGTSTTAYDQWIETSTDPNNKVKTYTYDVYRRLLNVGERNASSTYTTTYTWNHNNKLLTLRDATANNRNFTYDGLGRRKSATDLRYITDQSYGIWYYEYDRAGSLSSSTDPNGQIVNYTYDDLGRPLTEDYLGQPGVETVYMYDTCAYGKGRLCQSANSSATTTYAYTINGLVATTTKVLSGLEQTQIIAQQYNYQGNGTLTRYPDATEVRNLYNAAGQLERVEFKEVGGVFRDIIANFNYGPHGLVTYQLHGDGTVTTRVYDPNELYRLRSITTIATSTIGIGGGGEALRLLESSLGLKTAELPVTSVSTTESILPALNTRQVTESIITPAVEPIQEVIDVPSETLIDQASSTGSSTAEAPQASSTESITPVLEAVPTETTIATNTATSSLLTPQSRSEQLERREISHARISVLLEGKDKHERRTIKGRELALLNIATTTFIGNKGIRIEIVSKNAIPDGIQVFVRAWSGRTQLGFGPRGDVEIERIQIINPPILVRRGGQLVEDPEAALKESLSQIVGVIGQKGTLITRGKVGNTTTTVYPDAGVGGTSVDGMVRWSQNSSTWAQMHDSPVGHNVYSSATIQQGVGYYSANTTSLWWELYRSFFLFDTSSIPDNDVIGTTTLSLFGAGKYNVNGNDVEAYIVAGSPAQNNDLVAADYSQVGSIRLSDTDIPYASFASSTYNNYTLNAVGKAAISRDGVTKLAAREKKDFTNTVPRWYAKGRADSLQWYFADQDGTSWDPMLIIEHVTPTIPATSKDIQNLGYTYDRVGNITSVVDASELNPVTTSYTYDDLYRLKTASTTGATSTPYIRSYTYSPTGNMLTSNVGAYTYASTNYANPHAPTTIAGVTYSYDRNGNLASTSAGLLNIFNYRNRLVQSEGGSTTLTTYKYDADNARVVKAGAGTTTYYIGNLVELSGPTMTKYIYAGGTLVATIEGNGLSTTTYHHHQDHLASTKVITNDLGQVTQTLDYYPYGEKRLTTGIDHTSREYIGQITDPETNLSYLNARYYNSTQGQFITQDPVFWEIGETSDGKKILLDPQLANSYSYARDNPIVNKDPEGRFLVALAEAIMQFAQPTTAYAPAPGEENQTNQALETRIFFAGFASPYGKYGQTRSVFKNLVQGGVKAPAVNVTESRFRHVINRHTLEGKDFREGSTSYFNSGVDIKSIIEKSSNTEARLNNRGAYERVFDVGKNIGFDTQANKNTSVVTVITDKKGTLITAHPGSPFTRNQ